MFNMLSGLLGKGAAQVEDKVIVITDKRLDMYGIKEKTETEIHTQQHVFAVQDATIRINPAGGLYYLYNCSLPYLQEVEHLKQVEENIAIKSMFSMDADKKFDIKFYVLIAALVIVVFLLRK